MEGTGVSRRLDELAERVAALERALAGGRSSDLDTRLLAIETSLRQLAEPDQAPDDLDEVLRSCSELLERRVPEGERVMLAWQGDPATLALRGRPVVPFPRPRGALGEVDFENGASAVAHLEAQRAQGLRFLLVPDQGRRWLAGLPQFEEHLMRRYEVAEDQEGAGVLFDVGTRRGDERPDESLPGVLDRILDGERYAPVLDWTSFDLDSLTADRGIFEAPPDADDELPYLDRSIEVVVVDDPRDFEEGRRVASSAVVLVDPHEAGGVVVERVEELQRESASPADVTLVIPGVAEDDPWPAHVAEALAEPWINVVSGSGGLTEHEAADAEIVAIAERGVLPLPGCIDVSAAVLRYGDGVGAVAVKVLDADGLLESAGTTVFSDGSAEGIGSGSIDVSAPWHEYARPVCGATGLIVARSEALRGISGDPESLVDLSGQLWAAGERILYQPDAWAVRALSTNRSEPPQRPLTAWSDVLESRPRRPERLNTASWRWLLAHDDLEGTWG
jgi:hypothetical protein